MNGTAPAWMRSAACCGEDPDLFFGPDTERAGDRLRRERQASAVCSRCPVRAECREYALNRPEKHGYWGGMPEEERAVLRRPADGTAAEHRRAAA